MKSLKWMISYILVASLGLWMAFAVSARFMTPAHSQENPAMPETLPPPAMEEGLHASPDMPPASATPPQQEMPSIPPPPGTESSAGGVDVPPPPPAEGQTPLQDATPSGVTAPYESAVAHETYVYNPLGKRDPFKPFKSTKPAPNQQEGSTAATPVESLEPLQRWEVERLQIIAILWDVRSPRAMIKDPNGAVYTVVKNSKIGRYDGFVAAIREGEVVVLETKYDDGKTRKEAYVMEFKKSVL